jgi:dihydroorotate dehydrogenase
VFVSKTITLLPREGNMPLQRDWMTPQERLPRCIHVDPIGGHVLNCVSLSNSGAKVHFDRPRIRYGKDPFVISYAAVAETREERMEEFRVFLELFVSEKEYFLSRAILEVVLGCPNTGHDQRELLAEVSEMMDMALAFGEKLIININLVVMPEKAVEISNHPGCAAVSQSNSIPFGCFPDQIPWHILYGKISPLEIRGFKPGGYSGPCALPVLRHWVEQARNLQMGRRWLIVGGGIQSVEDADLICRVGGGALLGIKLGVVCIVRPWRVQRIIKAVNKHFRYIDRAVHSEGSK